MSLISINLNNNYYVLFQVRRVDVRADAFSGPAEQARRPQRPSGPRRRGPPGIVQDRAALGNTG